MIRLFCVVSLTLSILSLAACSMLSWQTDPEKQYAGYDETLIADGKMIAESQCGTCHGTGRFGSSPRADAPPLRRVLKNYDPENLAEDFREGVHVGHADMPDYEFGTLGTDAVLAYLISIQSK